MCLSPPLHQHTLTPHTRVRTPTKNALHPTHHTRFLWGYDPSMDDELQEVFDTVVAAGVNVSGRMSGQCVGVLW